MRAGVCVCVCVCVFPVQLLATGVQLFLSGDIAMFQNLLWALADFQELSLPCSGSCILDE